MRFLRWLLRYGLGPGYVAPEIEGACKMTGNCCRNLILVDRRRSVRTPAQFQRLLRRRPEYEMFRPNHPLGPPPADGLMRFHCANLGADNRCQIHEKRPEICRRYPSPGMFARGGNRLPGCGYRIKPKEPFRFLRRS